MARAIIFDDEVRERILDGAAKLAKVVGSTMGPRGRNVILNTAIGAPIATKDGVSVARQVSLSDPYENAACQLITEASGRSAAVAGDGTTATTVLTHQLIIEGQKLMKNGISPVLIRDGLEIGLRKIVNYLTDNAIKVDEDLIRSVAITATNNDVSLGGVIADAFNIVGQKGMVAATAEPGMKNSVNLVEGLELKTGYITQNFLNSGETSVTLNNCAILVYDEEMQNINKAFNENLLSRLHDENKSLLVICKDMKKQALVALVNANKTGVLSCCSIKFPIFAFRQEEWQEDLSLILGCPIVGDKFGKPLNSITMSDLGFAKRVEIDKYSTKFIEPFNHKDMIERKISIYKDDMRKLISEKERFDIQQRINFLAGRSALITVGYSTEVELREKSFRLDDALAAVRCAIESGCLPGGGFAILKAAKNIDISDIDSKYLPIIDILVHACARPCTEILRNADIDSTEIIQKVLLDDNLNFGFNVMTEQYGNMFDMKIVDTLKVVRTAIENAVSVASLLLTTDSIISDLPNQPEGWSPPPGWRPKESTSLNHQY